MTIKRNSKDAVSRVTPSCTPQTIIGTCEGFFRGRTPGVTRTLQRMALLVFGGTLLVSCGAQGDRSTETLGVSVQAIQSAYSVNLGFPAGFDQSNVALYATQTLRIADGVQVKSADGVYAAAVNVGTSGLELGAEGKTGTLISAGTLSLRSRAVVNGNAQSAGAITIQDGVKVTGSKLPNTPIGTLSKLRYSVQFSTATRGLSLEPDRTASLAPGAYTSVVAKSRSVVKLSVGTYYLDQLQMEPQAVVDLNTSGGPVLIYVRQSLNFKGTIRINGPDSSFFLSYLGTDAISIESAFNGTIVAPNATLRLAPVGNPGHRGSFFAKAIDAAEARTNITFDPFDYWFEVLNIHPQLKCVRRYKSPQAAALFGYNNESDFAVTIPVGSANRLTPAAGTTPPTLLQPGVHGAEFWAPFDIATGVTWALAGESASANATSSLCQLGDEPSGGTTISPSTAVPIDLPSISFDSIKGKITPDVTSSAFSHLPAPRYGTQAAVGLGPKPNSPSEPGDFTFTVNSLNFSDGEGACGSVEPYVRDLVINGQDMGQSTSGKVQVPPDQRTVHVYVDVNDHDSGVCGSDDHLRDYNFDVDLYTGGTNTCIDGGHLCYTANPTASPQVCFDWNAQFLDSSPWNDGVASEDGLKGRGIQVVPASFSRYNLKMANAGGVVHDRGGALDQNGCIPPADLPARDKWHLGNGLQVKLNLISQHCLDPDGTNCPQTSKLKGANVTVIQGEETGPATLCAVFAEDPGTVTDQNCLVRPIDWSAVPPSPLRPVFLDHNSVTRASAVVSHLLQREQETSGGLGIRTAMIDRRAESTGLLTVRVDYYCRMTDCSGQELLSSCRMQSELQLEPDGTLPSTTRFKYVIAHEFGHFVQGNGQGGLPPAYGCGAGDANQPVLCRCDQVPRDQQLHCLQSLEEPNAAQGEGFGQFFASKAFNNDLESDCTFAYYKPIANASCVPGAASCAKDTTTGLFISQPPIPISCRQAVRWRNTHCVDSSSSPDLLAYGTEYDWLEFLYAINNAANASERWSMTDIFDAYGSACADGASTWSACSVNVSWSGGNGYKSLTVGVKGLSDHGYVSRDAFNYFNSAGDAYGVSNKP